MKNILDILVKMELLNPYQTDDILERAVSGDRTLEAILSEMNISEEDILAAKSKHYDVPGKIIRPEDIDFKSVQIIPQDTAENYGMIAFGMVDGVLQVGMLDPSNIAARNALQFIVSDQNIPFNIVVITEKSYQNVFNSYHGIGTEVAAALSELATADAVDINKLEQGDESALRGNQQKIVEDAPVTKMVAVILRHAVDGGASDIHIEHIGEQVRVRFRVDGELFTSLSLPKNIHNAVVARVKILAKLKIDERRKPQDGRFPAIIDDRKVDFRVSIIPTYHAEKVVIRILDQGKGLKNLDELGLRDNHLTMVRDALSSPYGLVLITGPTGSGKTTTLYSMLQHLDRDIKNVVSLEDPIEYQVAGVSQSQVRPEIGFTFANGLRSIVRQDPDIIMVGEIRDGETAGLAVQAALTGHLVLATLHTNTATGAIPRLVDMGVDPYLIAPTLRLVIAQRLLRRICPGAQSTVDNKTPSIENMLKNQFSDLPKNFLRELQLGRPVSEAKSIPECASGVRGRIAVFEMFAVDNIIERTIIENSSEQTIQEILRKQYGMLSMREDAILKSMDGLIPWSEANTL